MTGISAKALDELLAEAKESVRNGDVLVAYKPPLLSALQELKSLRAILALAATVGRTKP